MPRVYNITGEKWLGRNHQLTVYCPDKIKHPNPILALHGMWATGQRWENYGRFFSEKGYLFLAPTLRHHYPGNNIPELGRTSINDYINDLKHLIWMLHSNKVLPGIDPLPAPIIFGHSMGGLLAQKLTENGYALKTVLLNSAPPAGISLHANFRYQVDTLRYLPKLLFKKPFKISFKLASHYVMNGMLENQHPELYKLGVYESGLAAREIKLGKIKVALERITCPVLVVSCLKDRIVPPQVGRDIKAKLINSRSARYLECGQAHWIQAEPGWEQPAQYLLLWLNA